MEQKQPQGSLHYVSHEGVELHEDGFHGQNRANRTDPANVIFAESGPRVTAEQMRNALIMEGNTRRAGFAARGEGDDMADEPLRVLICDDEPGMRLILGKLVGKAEGFEVVARQKTASRRWRCLKNASAGGVPRCGNAW